MREILFKAKTAAISADSYNSGKDDGEWVKGHIYNDVGCYRIRQFELNYADYVAYEIDPDTLCQYTDLIDKNGVKIFEGDVVKLSYVFENDCYYAVKFMEGYYDSGVYPFLGWCLANVNGEYEEALVEWKIKECSLGVVGNIYDNPELLDKYS